MEPSDSIKFVGSINHLTSLASKKRIADERRVQNLEVQKRTERVKRKLSWEKQKAREAALFRESERRVDVARHKLVTKEMFRIQARYNGFDLDNFSYEPQQLFNHDKLKVSASLPTLSFARQSESVLFTRQMNPSLSSVSIVSFPDASIERIEHDHNRKALPVIKPKKAKPQKCTRQ